MIVYQSDKPGFLDAVFKHDIEDVILDAYKARAGKSVSRSEVHSWKESLLAMAKVLNDDAIPDDMGVAVEYGIPQTSKRIDILLTGRNSDQREQLLIVELKQWETATRTAMDGVVRTRLGGGEANTSHPSYQAWSYACLLWDFNEAVYEGTIELQPCAYLHNYVDGAITDSFYQEHLERAPVFLKGEDERQKLRNFIRQHVRYGDSGRLLYRIEGGRIRPSKGLVESLSAMLAGKPEFVLVDDQKVVYETALARAREAEQTGTKQVVIVEGGPGTGKSVVAVNLLTALTKEHRVAKYVTKNAAPRAVFKAKLAGTMQRTRIDSLFVGSGAFTETGTNVFDTLVVDEAHRLNEKSGIYSNRGSHQVEEIIGSARCAIFFIDEDQRVTWKDVGEKRDIALRAKRAGAQVTSLQLDSQFRCSGSDGYLAWLDDMLQIHPTANTELDTNSFDFRVFDSPEELRKVIEQLNVANNKARMVAGYCWDWKSRREPQALDVVIPAHGFGMQWNLTDDGSLWIMAPDSVKQIGCIHTCQGLEVDYIGVIVGPDMIVRDGTVLTLPENRSRQDKSLHGYKKLLSTNPEEARRRAGAIIKNTYRTLMTRGMKGCYVYCTDDATRGWFNSRLQ